MKRIELVVFLLMIFSYIPYAVGILMKKISPAKSTWIIWFFLDLLLLMAMLQEHATNPSIIGATIGAGIIAVITQLKGKSGWSRIDSCCVIGATCGALAWMRTRDANLAVIFFLGSITIGAVPSFERAWSHPEYERKAVLSWLMRAAACVISLVNVQEWTIVRAGQPFVFSVIMLIMVLLPLRRKT